MAKQINISIVASRALTRSVEWAHVTITATVVGSARMSGRLKSSRGKLYQCE